MKHKSIPTTKLETEAALFLVSTYYHYQVYLKY